MPAAACDCLSGVALAKTEAKTKPKPKRTAASSLQPNDYSVFENALLRHFEGLGDAVKNRRVTVEQRGRRPSDDLDGFFFVRIDVKPVFDFYAAERRRRVIRQPVTGINLDRLGRSERTIRRLPGDMF